MKKREWKTTTQWRSMYNWTYGDYLSYWDVLAMIKSGELQAEKVGRVWRIYTTPAEIFAKRQKIKSDLPDRWTDKRKSLWPVK